MVRGQRMLELDDLFGLASGADRNSFHWNSDGNTEIVTNALAMEKLRLWIARWIIG